MFPISSKYINHICGLHLEEYQTTNILTGQLGFYNSKNEFIKCSCNKHISREKYNEVIPLIINE